MSVQEDTKAESSAKTQAFQEISSNFEDSNGMLLAPGVGFEPARPFQATGYLFSQSLWVTPGLS